MKYRGLPPHESRFFCSGSHYSSIRECICQDIKVLMVSPFVTRGVTVHSPGTAICGRPSFKKTTRAPPGAPVVWREKPRSAAK